MPPDVMHHARATALTARRATLGALKRDLVLPWHSVAGELQGLGVAGVPGFPHHSKTIPRARTELMPRRNNRYSPSY
jgi:hypothetical protein